MGTNDKNRKIISVISCALCTPTKDFLLIFVCGKPRICNAIPKIRDISIRVAICDLGGVVFGENKSRPKIYSPATNINSPNVMTANFNGDVIVQVVIFWHVVFPLWLFALLYHNLTAR